MVRSRFTIQIWKYSRPVPVNCACCGAGTSAAAGTDVSDTGGGSTASTVVIDAAGPSMGGRRIGASGAASDTIQLLIQNPDGHRRVVVGEHHRRLDLQHAVERPV